ncbi:HemK2/MTQ2 family protein methyltransferase [Nonomuraea sp. NPDC050536]|uniref:HemK2/MTQ2 family protein methyltransferase n=1 Tax=Nonomuraea sp. NPDC050536 TaxID=3364366 RepID=UPI0037C65FB7
MLLLRPAGVYRPQADTGLLLEALARDHLPPGARVLDLCTGTGLVALVAARGAVSQVTAVDMSRRAVLAARFNALVRGLRVRVIRGDLFAPLQGESFDVILANPPYVAGPARNTALAWDAGIDGRRVLDPICVQAPAYLSPGGTLLIVQSALSGVAASLRQLRTAGLDARVVTRRWEPFGPVMRDRASWLEARGLIRPGQRHEELVVIRARRRDAVAGRRAA